MTNRKPPEPGAPKGVRQDPLREKPTLQRAPASSAAPAPVRRTPPKSDQQQRGSSSFGAATPQELAAQPQGQSRPANPRHPGSSAPAKLAPTRSAGNQRPRAPSRRKPPPPARLWPKVVAGLAVVLLVGVGAAVFAVDRLIPVEAIRERAIAEVKARTGRTLTIGEHASVSFWPRLAVVLNDVTLSEPPAMGAAAFARAGTVEAQAEIWPLLTGQVKLERLVLKDPVIEFRIDRNGRRSWDFATNTASAPIRYAQVGRVADVTPRPKELDDFAKGATPPSQPNVTRSAADKAALKSVQIVNGTLRHLDERTGKSETLTGLTASLTADSLAAPVSVEGHATWRGKIVNASAVAQPFRAVIDQKPFALRSTLTAPDVDISFAGNVALTAGPNIDGNLTIKSGSIQSISAWAGLPLGGGISNGPLDFKANTRTDAVGVNLSEMTLAVEGMTVRGGAALAINGVPRPRLAAILQASAVNIDQLTSIRLLDRRAAAPPPSRAAEPASPASIDDLLKPKPATPAARPQVKGFTGRNGWSDEPIDLTSLGLLDADVKLTFNALTAGKLRTGNGQTAITLVNRVGRAEIIDLQLYEGRARGTFTADATNAGTPVVGANVILDGVSSLDFLRDAGGVDIIAGKARISTALSGQGQSERQIVETLTGKAEIAMANGALVGISIPKILQALSQGRQPSFERVATDRSEFSELSGSVNILNGVAQNQDLKFTTPQVRVTGTGTVNLPARTIDYVARPKLAGPQSIKVGQMTLNVGIVDVPVRVVGTFDKIAVAPELLGIVKNPNQAVEAIKKLDRKEAESTVKGVLDGDPAAKAKAREFLKNLIK